MFKHHFHTLWFNEGDFEREGERYGERENRSEDDPRCLTQGSRVDVVVVAVADCQ